MPSERSYFDQESDVSRACSAFGLDTVNYRAFPGTGPALRETQPPQSGPSQSGPSQIGPSPEPRAATPFFNPPLPGTGNQPAVEPDPTFPLLAQAIPPAQPDSAPAPAFSKARTRLNTARPSGPTNRPDALAFGAAFGAAYREAFGFAAADAASMQAETGAARHHT